jgi:hypothetical protein
MIFGGKTSSLVSRGNGNMDFLDPNFLSDVNAFESKLRPLDHLFGKTSGWVTKFVDFSVDLVSNEEHAGSKFQERFRIHFPELHGILSKL